MTKKPIVLDTNVLVSCLRSRYGYSFKLLERILTKDVTIVLSTPLILEYESTLKSLLVPSILSTADVDTLLDFLCSIGVQARIFYLWRPYLRDPYEDHILELAVASGAQFIVTYNRKDFQGIEKFGVMIAEPREILRILEGSL